LNRTANQTSNESLNLAYESIDSCSGYIDHIVGKIQKLVAHFQANEIKEANEELIEVVELMDLYIQLITRVFQVIRLHNRDASLKEEGIQKLEIHLLSIIKALLLAREKNDVIMLCDLLEYELIDNLTQWKIKALPELRKSKNI
jgi:hypothetical protein